MPWKPPGVRQQNQTRDNLLNSLNDDYTNMDILEMTTVVHSCSIDWHARMGLFWACLFWSVFNETTKPRNQGKHEINREGQHVLSSTWN